MIVLRGTIILVPTEFSGYTKPMIGTKATDTTGRVWEYVGTPGMEWLYSQLEEGYDRMDHQTFCETVVLTRLELPT